MSERNWGGLGSPDPRLAGLIDSRLLFDALLDAVVVATMGGEILAVNRAASALLGATEGELIRQGRAGILDLGDPRLPAALEVRNRTGVFRGELNFRRQEGGVFPVELASSAVAAADGSPLSVLVFRDISTRQETERALRLSEERFAKAFHTSPDGITISRLSDGRYVEINRGFTELSGYGLDEVLGRTSLELGIWLRPEDRASFVATLKDQGEVVNLDVTFRFKGGVLKNTLVSARILDLGGEPCVLSTTRDMTAKEKLAETLQRTQKLESLGLLAGGIAHDFNNMLGGIFGFIELAQSRLAAGQADAAGRYLERAVGIHGRARGLTEQLLTFSKGGAPIPRCLPLEPLWRHNIAFALSGSNVTPEWEFSPDLWPCEVDETQMGQVIDNLAINAKQAMESGGVLRLTGRNRLDPPGHPGRFVEVTVADSGPGIAPENLSRIFDPFFSTKATGHGLGLATVFSIVRRHGGWLEVESCPGQGAQFRVILPAAERTPQAEAERPAREGPGGGRVLVLDDEVFLQDVLTDLLEGMGYEPVACSRSGEALRLYQQAAAEGRPFVAAILDLTVPGDAGGAEAARLIRQFDPQAYLLAASGYADSPIFQHPEEFGFSGRIAKPYLRASLADLLSRGLPPPPAPSTGPGVGASIRG